MTRLPIFVLIWVGMMALKLPVAILGLIVVPALYPYRARHYDELPFWTRPWANPEDWTGGPQGVVGESLPAWWIKREGSGFGPFWKYHAIRNPANGLRSFEALDLDIMQGRVRFHTPRYFRYYEPWHIRKLDDAPRTVWYLAWQGWKAGFKFVHLWNDERYLELKIGWRVEPRDAKEPLDPDGQRALEGAGFASKFLPYREG